MKEISLKINGESKRLAVKPNSTLLAVLVGDNREGAKSNRDGSPSTGLRMQECLGSNPAQGGIQGKLSLWGLEIWV